jgi:hypothetical protein
VTRRRLAIAVALALLAAPAGPARSQDVETRAFVARVVETINSKDLERRRVLVHPACQRCTKLAPELFYNVMVARQAREPIPPDYTWKLEPVPAGEPLMFADQFDYPARPTHMLQITFTPAPSSSKTLVVQLVREGKSWFEMIPCPKPATIVKARETQAANVKRAERVQTLVSGMAPDLKAKLVDMVKTGSRLNAAKHYQSVSGEDLTTAVDVVEQLAPR